MQSHLDYSLFTKRVRIALVIILVYVDDMMITSNDINLIQETKQALLDTFNK